MAQTSINIRMDEDLKKQVEYLFSEFGMNMTTAFTVFAKAVVREKRIPFEISAVTDDFYWIRSLQRIPKWHPMLIQSETTKWSFFFLCSITWGPQR